MSNKIINESINNPNKNISYINSIIKNNEKSNDLNYNKKNSDKQIKKLKNQSNNCNINKKNLYIKKLVFNPISLEDQKKLRKSILSPIPHGSIKNKNYSSIELKPVPISKRRKLQPLNLNKSSSEVIFSINKRNLNNRKFSFNINSNNNDDYINKGFKQKNINLKLIGFFTKYKYKDNKDYKDIEVKNKYKPISNSKHIQEFKKSISDLYNKIDEPKKFLYKANFIHKFLFNTDRVIYQNSDSLSFQNKYPKNIQKIEDNVISNDYDDINEIKPKYEYIDYFGKENKIITKLTTNSKDTSTYNNEIKNIINNLKLNKQLRAPKLIALKDSDEYRNKNYIKLIQKKNEREKKEGEEEKKRKERGIKQIINISKKGFEQLKTKKIKKFSGLIQNTIKEHKSVIKKLDNMIEIDKQNYQKEFDIINPNLDIYNE